MRASVRVDVAGDLEGDLGYIWDIVGVIYTDVGVYS
jgi:hypothetical protein